MSNSLFGPDPTPPTPPIQYRTSYIYTIEEWQKIADLRKAGHSQTSIVNITGLPRSQVHHYMYYFNRERKVAKGKPGRKPKSQPMIPKVFDTDRLLQPDIETPAPRRSGNTEKVYMVPVPQSKLALVAEVLWQS